MKHILLALALTSPLLGACKSEGAKQGATQGAMYGALGAAVSSVVWGRDDVLGDAARGAVVGATVGGVSGAVNESNRNEAQQRQAAQAQQRADLTQENKDLALRNQQLEMQATLTEEIGPDNTEAVNLLVRCDHAGALAASRRSADSLNEHFRTAGVWLEAVNAQDQRHLAATRSLYPRLVKLDDEIETEEQAELIVLDLVTALEDSREEYGLRRRCD
jgi:hypothetical protein